MSGEHEPDDEPQPMRAIPMASTSRPGLGSVRMCRLPKGAIVYRIERGPDVKLREVARTLSHDVAIFVREGFLGSA